MANTLITRQVLGREFLEMARRCGIAITPRFEQVAMQTGVSIGELLHLFDERDARAQLDETKDR